MGGAHLTRIKVPDSDRNVLIYIVDIIWVCLFLTLPKREFLSRGYVSRVCFGVCFAPLYSNRKTKMRGMFRGGVSGYASPKSNFPAVLEVECAKKIETHMHAIYKFVCIF